MAGLSEDEIKLIIKLAALDPPPDPEEVERMERVRADWFAGKIL
jgi:hypothetical protein